MEELKYKILQATNNGLDILLKIYPQAQQGGKLVKFKIRSDERTPSALLFEGGSSNDKIWFVKDFGSDYSANPFTAYMQANNIDNFAVCLRMLAEEYNIDCSINKRNNQSNIEYRDAEPGHQEKERYTVLKDEITDEELKALGPFVTQQVMKDYNYFAVKEVHYFFKDKNGILKELITYSTPTYPIFTHKMSWDGTETLPDGSSVRKKYEWEKVYMPKEPKKENRFFVIGKKPAKYINGLSVALKSKNTEILICAGERDSLNAAGMGYTPVWFNSETELIDAHYIKTLRDSNKKIIYVGDIDKTGLEATRQNALMYPDMFTIVLPSEMQQLVDARGNKSKDLLDFIYYNQRIDKDGKIKYSKYEFDLLVRTCRRCQFWEFETKANGKETVNLSTLNLLYFLELSGFAKYRIPNSHNTMFVRIDGYKVEEVEPKQIRSYIRNYLISRHESTLVIETFLNSKKTTVSLFDDLNEKEMNFSYCDHESRTFYFENKAIKVTKDGIETVNTKEMDNYCWKSKIIPHRIELPKEPMLCLEDGRLAIKSLDSKLLCYLINSSRMYWREELEQNITGDPVQDAEYARVHRYWYWSEERLTREQNLRQEEFLKNKLYCIGRMLHRYKFFDKAQCIWIMESTSSAEKTSNGRSGKSFIMTALEQLNLIEKATLEGRNKKLTDNQHYMDQVKPSTDVLQIDDTDYDFSFNDFYSKITGSMTINPKGLASYTIRYKDAPNIVFTSNFAPKNLDQSSTMARILPMVYSDYYHQVTEDNPFGYRENRSIADDFDGLEFYGHAYTNEDRNNDYIMFLYIMQIYLQWIATNTYNGVPPMEEVLTRANKGKMGTSFEEWANDYFSTDADNLNRLIPKLEAYDDYARTVTNKKDLKTATAFKSALKAFCKIKGYVYNPEDIKGRMQDGRIIENEVIDGKKKTVEKIYIRYDDPNKIEVEEKMNQQTELNFD